MSQLQADELLMALHEVSLGSRPQALLQRDAAPPVCCAGSGFLPGGVAGIGGNGHQRWDHHPAADAGGPYVHHGWRSKRMTHCRPITSSRGLILQCYPLRAAAASATTSHRNAMLRPN